MINGILIYILVYILSVVGMYLYFRTAYSKGGKYSGGFLDWGFVFFTFCPIFNTILLGSWIFDYPIKRTKTEKLRELKNFDKFFNIQK